MESGRKSLPAYACSCSGSSSRRALVSPFLTTREKRSRETRNLLIPSWMSKKEKEKKPNIFYHLKQTLESIHPSVTLRARPCKYPRWCCHNKPSSISRDFEKKACAGTRRLLLRGEKKNPKKERVTCQIKSRYLANRNSEQKPKVSKGSFLL